MRGLVGVWPLVRERLLASWRLLAVLAFGVLAASTLLAVSPIYTRVMTDLGLKTSLQQQLRNSTRDSLIQFQLPLGTTQAADQESALTRALAENLSWLTASEVRFGAVTDLTYGREGQAPNGRPPLVSLQTSSRFEDHVRVLEGRLPAPTTDPSRLEVVLPKESADFLGLHAGDRFFATASFDDCNRPPPTDDPQEARDRARFPCIPTTTVTLQASFTVAGVVDQSDANDPYWGAGRTSFNRPAATDTSAPIAMVLMPEESFYRALPLVLPGVRSEFRITSFADPSRLNSGNLDRAREDLARIRASVSQTSAIADLAMDNALGQFHARASFNQVPLLLLLLQVAGIAVYYVLLVASMLVERRSEETAVLRSRGAALTQVVAAAAVEAGIIGAGATLVAPFLAGGAVALLGKTGAFHSVSAGHFLAFQVTPLAFGFAAGGAALSIVAVIIPTFFGARRGMAVFLRSTSRPGRPFLQRYYVDVALVGLAALGLWELNQRGSVFDPRSVGGWSADPLLLLSPLLLVLAIGALMFRFLPLVVGIAGRLASRTAGAGVALGLWRLTRNPARYTQLALLVVMAAAVGTFAATYGQTTDRSQTDRARYETGVDVRATSLGSLGGASPAQAQDQLRGVPGVEEAATAYRTNLALGPLPGFGASIPVLGLDPQVAPSLLWFRSDFASEPLPNLLRRIEGSAAGGQGLLLPGEPTAISVWTDPAPGRDATTLWARTLDAAGTYRLAELGTLDFQGYRQLTAQLNPEQNGIVYPLSIVGLLVTQPEGSRETITGSLLLDDVSVRDANGEETVVEDFEGPFRWSPLLTATRNHDTATKSTAAHRGSAAAELTFRIGSTVPIRGLILSDPNIPLPAIASRNFLAHTGARVGSEVDLVMGSLLMPVSIRGVVDFFPTMSDEGSGFLILNQRHLYYFAGLTNQMAASGPDEAWLKLTTEPDQRIQALSTLGDKYRITDVVDSAKVLKDVRSDPLVQAGGSGVLLLALIAALAVLALGFALTLYLGGQTRTVEMSVMRAMGFSSGQVFGMVALEYLVVAGIGLVVGTLAGLRISATMLSFLNVTENGTRLVPPFALTTRWDLVGIAFGTIAAAFIAGIVALALYFLRLPVSRVLRLTR